MLHKPILPMLLHKADKPPEKGYLFQPKFDGFRCILSYNGNNIKLFTRHQTECTFQFPELQIHLPVKNVVLDGEMISFDETGNICFESVMQRFQARKEFTIRHITRSIPAHFVAFDLLYLNGTDYTKRPIEERLEVLNAIIPQHNVISVCPIYEDGFSLLHHVVNLGMDSGLDGITCKKKGSHYEINKRSQNWLKVKNYYYDDVEIAGIRKGKFGWLLSKKRIICRHFRTRTTSTPKSIPFSCSSNKKKRDT
ncbi:DNA polymerase LigD [Brevibacillus marinus]|uniref:ATP-dependent DNA ligase n=1 Tax=Brevibacillus marinus TaxID=2496837 RepID=UPI000F834C6B|nr:DNA polymerase LigD [Brevibacillus marinus]